MFKRLRPNAARKDASSSKKGADPTSAQQYKFNFVVNESAGHATANVFVGDMTAEIPPEAVEKAEFIATEVVRQKLGVMVEEFAQLKSSQEQAMLAMDAMHQQSLAHQISMYEQQLEEIKARSMQHIGVLQALHKQTEAEYHSYKEDAEEQIEELRDKVAALGIRIREMLEQHKRAIVELEEEHEQALVSISRYHDIKLRYTQDLIEREAIITHAVAVTMEHVVTLLETQLTKHWYLQSEQLQPHQSDAQEQWLCTEAVAPEISREVAMAMGAMVQRIEQEQSTKKNLQHSQKGAEVKQHPTNDFRDHSTQTAAVETVVTKSDGEPAEANCTHTDVRPHLARSIHKAPVHGNNPDPTGLNEHSEKKIRLLQQELASLQEQLDQTKALHECCERYRMWKAEGNGMESMSNELEQRLGDLRASQTKLEANLQAAVKLKKTSKVAIKKWLQEFVATNGREPTNEDKEAIKHAYIQHKRSSNDVTAEQARITEVKQQIAQLQEEVFRANTAQAQPLQQGLLAEIHSLLGIEVHPAASTLVPAAAPAIQVPPPAASKDSNHEAEHIRYQEIIRGWETKYAQLRAKTSDGDSSAHVKELEDEIQRLRRDASSRSSDSKSVRQQIEELSSSLQLAEERYNQLMDIVSKSETGNDVTLLLQQQLHSLTKEMKEHSVGLEQQKAEAYNRGKEEGVADKEEALQQAMKKWQDEREELEQQLEAARASVAQTAVQPHVTQSITEHTASNDQKERPAPSKEAHRPRATQPSATSGKEIKPAAIKQLEKKQAEDAKTIRQLQNKLEHAQNKLDQAIQDAQNASSLAATSADIQKAAAAAERKLRKQLDEQEKRSQKESDRLNAQLRDITVELGQTQDRLEDANKQIEQLRQATSEMTALSKQLDELRAQANLVHSLEVANREQESKIQELVDNYKKEMVLRKKYKNEIENMKGKIRVFARCRPMADYEVARGSQQVVKFIDDCTLELETSRGPKNFEFDTVYTMTSTQEEVFEDVRGLIESCLDGYNVCVFAYGQTGSGKTFTMTGSPELQGLTPRTIQALFNQIQERTRTHTITVGSYFVELYNEHLHDLYFKLDNPRAEAPKLEIKLDSAKMVYIKNVLVKPCQNHEDLFRAFEQANLLRKTGATNMNAGSSRSHSIFSILIQSHDKTTQRVTVGKLSLVDLAGSERADKTGATAERLREAQSINKSLSALGDVISALCENEKFIPYRNNKLTQLMQDSLGGNAKTLMFVNISPADYNADETLTSLLYATRVKKITNQATKVQDSAEVARLKAIIRELKSGYMQAGETDFMDAGDAAEESKEG